MATLTASMRGFNAVAVVGLFSVVLGPVPYFLAFLFAYGFNDQIVFSTHVYFLVEIAIIAAVIAVLATIPVRAASSVPLGRAFRLSLSISLAIHLTLVAIASFVSAINADHGSVTADYSWMTDVMLTAGLLAAAAASAWIAIRSRPL